MKFTNEINKLIGLRNSLTEPPGLVPTMGYLHDGHLSLIREARKRHRMLVVSIFVNPHQFGPKEDYHNYPQNLERDLDILKQENVDIVFAPAPEEIYPEGFDTWVEVGDLTRRLEGFSRPGHFKGVATVVLKLFNIIRPGSAYFGQKDAQQALVIQKMVTDLNMGIDIHVLPTVRDSSGLALSSRNVYLSVKEKNAAAILKKSLDLASERYQAGEIDASVIKDSMLELIQSEPLVKTDYISIASPQTLHELETISGPALVSLAAWIGKTRLIDNILI